MHLSSPVWSGRKEGKKSRAVSGLFVQVSNFLSSWDPSRNEWPVGESQFSTLKLSASKAKHVWCAIHALSDTYRAWLVLAPIFGPHLLGFGLLNMLLMSLSSFGPKWTRGAFRFLRKYDGCYAEAGKYGCSYCACLLGLLVCGPRHVIAKLSPKDCVFQLLNLLLHVS